MFWVGDMVYYRQIPKKRAVGAKCAARKGRSGIIAEVNSLGLHGINGFPVTVECHISSGLPGFDVVGLPDAAVKEARERVRAAVKTAGSAFPSAALR